MLSLKTLWFGMLLVLRFSQVHFEAAAVRNLSEILINVKNLNEQ